jgi:hypothetical protein
VPPGLGGVEMGAPTVPKRKEGFGILSPLVNGCGQRIERI